MSTAQVDTNLNHVVSDFLIREAWLIDNQRWADWLELFTDDTVFWVPSWNKPGETVKNPDVEVNLLYITDKFGVEERLTRIESGESAASTPTRRTCHHISNVMIHGTPGADVQVTANWIVTSYGEIGGAQSRSGHYEYLLRRNEGDFMIARKKAVLLDELVAGFIDIYLI